MLLLPGPVEVPEAVLKASAYVQNHRSQEFRDIVREASERLNVLADSSHALITTGSGTSAVESIVYSMISPGEEVLALTNGEFGDRMVDSLRRRGAIPTVISKSHSETVDVNEIEDLSRRNPMLKTLFLVHNETGNGTAVRNLKGVATRAKELGMKVLVDSVSGFGGMEIRANSWGIDAFASCSQKSLASVPGIGIVCISGEGEKLVLGSGDMPAYLDLKNSMRFMSKFETPYTPSTGGFNALLTALKILDREGPEKRWKRHREGAAFVRRQLTEHGIEVYGNNSNYSDTMVAFRPSSPSSEIVRKLAARNIIVARGIKDEAETMIRVGLMGLVSGTMISAFLNGLYVTLGIQDTVREEDLPASTRVDPGILNV